MPDFALSAIDDRTVVGMRPARNIVDPQRPYAFLVESERTAAGRVETVATIFLTNRECPFRCVFCDLWKNTTQESVSIGAIPAQIDYALERLPQARHVKLYNAGSFFDAHAIPRADYGAIAQRVKAFNTVIVENHPRFCSDECLRFRDLIETQLEIAIGLETIHPAVLPRLNKRMTVEDFDRAAGFLLGHGIAVRAFVLLGLPFLNETDACEWAIRSVHHADRLRVTCCSIIPMREGNGIMDELSAAGAFTRPSLRSIEDVLDACIRASDCRVFVDLWDIERVSRCPRCGPARAERLRRMNDSQVVLPRIECGCEPVR